MFWLVVFLPKFILDVIVKSRTPCLYAVLLVYDYFPPLGGHALRDCISQGPNEMHAKVRLAESEVSGLKDDKAFLLRLRPAPAEEAAETVHVRSQGTQGQTL